MYNSNNTNLSYYMTLKGAPSVEEVCVYSELFEMTVLCVSWSTFWT